MIIPSFITRICHIGQINYPGQIARCQFSVAGYHDSDFRLTNISLPESLSGAVKKRKAEYLAGRYLVRYMMRCAGVADSEIHSGKDREPCWPAGITGSISHNKDTAICAMNFGQPLIATGIDIETIMTWQTASDLSGSVISETEVAYLSKLTASYPFLLTLAFSAKESLFKAIYPQIRKYVGFLDASIIGVDQQHCCFTLQLNIPLLPHFRQGHYFYGQYRQRADAVMTVIYF